MVNRYNFKRQLSAVESFPHDKTPKATRGMFQQIVSTEVCQSNASGMILMDR